MYHIIYTAQHQSFDYKTNKSIYNILIGKKSHQTFFDACSQQLLSLYHSLPHLKYPSFERFLNEIEEFEPAIAIHSHPRYTYDSMVNTFNALQLFIQTVTHVHHQVHQFVPMSQQHHIQQVVKQLYHNLDISSNTQQIKDIEKELYQLFSMINTKHHSYLHYYLQGFDEAMYTRQQVSLIEGITQQQLFEFEMLNLIDMMYELERAEDYPILNQLIILPSLLKQTHLTYQKLLHGQTLNEIATRQQVKLNTIEDHVLELFIKGYMSNYLVYFNETEMKSFLTFYQQHQQQRLKYYKAAFEELNYFQIKLMIIGYERGDLNASTTTS